MLTLPLTLMLAACVCFVVALLVAVAAVSGNFDAWLAGGALAACLSFVLVPFAPKAPQ